HDAIAMQLGLTYRTAESGVLARTGPATTSVALGRRTEKPGRQDTPHQVESQLDKLVGDCHEQPCHAAYSQPNRRASSSAARCIWRWYRRAAARRRKTERSSEEPCPPAIGVTGGRKRPSTDAGSSTSRG